MNNNLQPVVLVSALSGAMIMIVVVVVFLRRQNRKRREQSWFDVEDLKMRTDAEEDLLVMDVRTPEDFVGEQGHLVFARNLPLEELKHRLDELAEDVQRPIAIVCRTDRRSAKAAALLEKGGFVDVHVVRGGMTVWLERGWPTAG